jgi:hypothetical protein
LSCIAEQNSVSKLATFSYFLTFRILITCDNRKLTKNWKKEKVNEGPQERKRMEGRKE